MSKRKWIDQVVLGTIYGLLACGIVLGSAYGILEHQKKVREMRAELALYKAMVDEAVKMITDESPLVALDSGTGDIYVKSFGRVHQYPKICRPEMGL